MQQPPAPTQSVPYRIGAQQAPWMHPSQVRGKRPHIPPERPVSDRA